MLVVAAIKAETPPPGAAVRLAAIAATEELVAVCAYEMAAPLLTGVRAARPGIRVVALIADPPTAAEAAVVESLLDEGAMPMLVTAAERIDEVSAWSSGRLGGVCQFTLDPDLTVAVV